MTPDVARTAGEIFRRRVFAARSLDRDEKLLAGPRLFERACMLASAGLRQRLALGDPFVRHILEHGKLLYASPDG